MDKKFKPGDVVQLKSGGPKMTVSRYHLDIGDAIIDAIFRRKGKEPQETTVVECEWFDGARSVNGKFEQDLLQFATA